MSTNQPRPNLTNIGGFVDKKELRERYFQCSKKIYLRSIKLLCQYDQKFHERYRPYHLKSLIPLALATDILNHLDLLH